MYRPLLQRWSLQLGLQHSDAEDLTQDVLSALMVKLPHFVYGEKDGKFRGWLKTVLRNKYLDKKRQRAPVQADMDVIANDRKIGDDDLSFIEAEYTQCLVRRALEIMKSEFQTTTWQACWMLVVEDRPAAEVARELAAISVGLLNDEELLDLEYVEDKDAEVDLNLVMTGSGQFIEVQGTGEEATFSRSQLDRLLTHVAQLVVYK